MSVRGAAEARLIAMVRSAHRDLGLGGQDDGPQDAALLSEEGIVVTVDAFVEGVHFNAARMAAHDAGYRAVMATLSDLAASGAEPVGHLLSLVLPPSMPLDTLESLAGGLAAAAQAAASPLLGGNVTQGGELAIHISALGRVSRPLRRRRGLPGDLVVVSGPIGLAAEGREAVLHGHPASKAAREAFLHPRACLGEGRLLAALGARSATDVTDGLAVEIREIMGKRARGADLGSEALLGDRGLAALGRVLEGGDDYELLVAVPPDTLGTIVAAFAEAGLRTPIVLGTLRTEAGLRLDGRPLTEASGWDPFREVGP